MMNIIIWLLHRFVKLIAPYYETPQVGVEFPGALKDWDCPEDAVYDTNPVAWPNGDQELYEQHVAAHAGFDWFSPHLEDQKAELGFFTTLANEDEVITSTQWGLQLPNGEVHWGSWSNIDFSTPLDRMRMIATLQKTALEMGLNANGQSDEFLNKYKWQTREATARIRYKNIGMFPLTDPAVSAAPVENSTNEQPQDDSETHVHSYRDLHPGFVGGDA